MQRGSARHEPLVIPWPALRGGICINGGRIFLGRNEYPRREVKEYSFSFFFFALSLQDALQTYAARLARDIPWDVMHWSR